MIRIIALNRDLLQFGNSVDPTASCAWITFCARSWLNETQLWSPDRRPRRLTARAPSLIRGSLTRMSPCAGALTTPDALASRAVCHRRLSADAGRSSHLKQRIGLRERFSMSSAFSGPWMRYQGFGTEGLLRRGNAYRGSHLANPRSISLENSI